VAGRIFISFLIISGTVRRNFTIGDAMTGVTGTGCMTVVEIAKWF